MNELADMGNHRGPCDPAGNRDTVVERGGR